MDRMANPSLDSNPKCGMDVLMTYLRDHSGNRNCCSERSKLEQGGGALKVIFAEFI